MIHLDWRLSAPLENQFSSVSTAALIAQAHRYGGVMANQWQTDFQSIGALLAFQVSKQPHALFLKYFDDDSGEVSQLTYVEFAQAVVQAAAFLTAQKLRTGDCIATLSHNHPLAAVWMFAGWQLGLVVAPQNASEDNARIAFILQDAGAKLIIAHPTQSVRAREIVALMAVDALNIGIYSYADSAAYIDGQITSNDDFRAQAALLVYTSGTTGQPKGAVLTQYNLLINAQATAAWHGLTVGSRLMCVLPIHHVNGIVVTLLTPLYAGASVVLNRGFKASTFWQRLRDEDISIVSVVPTILQFLCEAADSITALDLPQFKYFICGAGTLPIALIEKFVKQFSTPVLHGYGLSETTAFCCTMPAKMTEETRKYWISAFGYPSIGTPFAHCEMAIFDAQGHTLRHSERGEIVIRGHYIMDGYLHRAQENAETFKHGWFRSGDEGFFEYNETGEPFFFITGRLKELINRGGVKYSPFEIEEVLLGIPGVKVGLAIAFDNDWYGEEVGAYVVRDVTTIAASTISEAEIVSACRAKMPFSKCPKVVIFGDEVPVTVTGKYQRLKLKPLFVAFQKTQFRENLST
jgi:long-chain acyl-CoA synthetase